MKKLILIIAIINIIGFLYGLQYYSDQMGEVPAFLWVFLLDSPIAVLLAAAVFILLLFNKTNRLLISFASFACIKYGIWTMFVLLYFSDYFFSPEHSWLYYSMFITHAAMVVEGVFLTFPKTKRYVLYPVSIFFLLNDILDYSLGVHTSLPAIGEKVFITAVFSITLTLVIFIFKSRGITIKWPGELQEIKNELKRFLNKE